MIAMSVLVPVGTAFLAVLTGWVSLAGAPEALRMLVVGPFLLLGPGLPWAHVLGLHDTTVKVTIGVALSLALDLLVATVLFYAGVWSWQLAIGILMLLSLGGAGLALIMYQISFIRSSGGA